MGARGAARCRGIRGLPILATATTFVVLALPRASTLQAFLFGDAGSAVAGRRSLLLGAPFAALAGAGEAIALPQNIADIDGFIITRKKLYLPSVAEGYVYLDKNGPDKRFMKYLPTMASSMNAYSQCFSGDIKPDATVRGLFKDVTLFAQLCKDDKKDEALAQFEVWRKKISDIYDLGGFDPKDKYTYLEEPDAADGAVTSDQSGAA